MKVYKLYNNTVDLFFDEENHKYFVNELPVDGTTGILSVINKPALLGWAVKVTVEFLANVLKPGVALDEVQIKALLEGAKRAHRQKKTDAADIGTFVHDWIKDYIAGKKPAPPVNEQIKNAVDTFLSWEKDQKVEFLESERAIYSKQYGYAGTLDFIAKIGGKTVLGDFKTSSGIWDEYFLQIAAYQQAYLEEFPDKTIVGGVIVRIGKDGTLETKETTKYDKDVLGFNGALVLYRRLQELKNEKR
ncbi:MAG: hypothetical protein KGI08_10295 [Thaumarchaeota archaeon]|nr:hypothetical protein [Nitrososphaerota archaeon]